MLTVDRVVEVKVSNNAYSAKIRFADGKDRGEVVFQRATMIETEDGEKRQQINEISLPWDPPPEFQYSASYDPRDFRRPALVEFLRELADQLERGK